MRPIFRSLAFMAVLIVGMAHAGTQELRNFAILVGLLDIDGFVETVETIRDTGWLPEQYLTKNEARDRGWQPGDDLCDSAPGHVIGGNRFGNREGRLPDRRGRQWTEADLDFGCGRRGAKRLLFSSDGLIFVTIDHYETFFEVPE
ncbi:MAG: ribonuclease domain-containing protein [Geminicoccaceae bacterium]|nr:hypothetical protein [Geminicoccaceae bacterium]